MLRTLIIILSGIFFLPGTPVFSQQGHFAGHLYLDSSWRPTVFLSKIPDFSQMFTASEKLIIAKGDIDSTGYFSIDFPADRKESLYRFHVSRSTDPIATLIIGGNEENYGFFVARDSSKLRLESSSKAKVISQKDITGGRENQELNSIFNTMADQGLDRDSLKNRLIFIAEHCSSELAGLYAVYSLFGLSSQQITRVGHVLRGYDHRNPYGAKIFQEYKRKDNRTLFLNVFVVLFLLIIAYRLRGHQKRQHSKAIQLLSHREKSIAILILSGKTNKEIANELAIELSTVKTHANNIYSKLNVKSRKELARFGNAFKADNNSMTVL